MSTIFVNVQGFSSIGKEIVFLAKEKSKEKVVTDLMQRYANVINENIKGKTLKEKKLWYRKLEYKYQHSYNGTTQEQRLFLKRMVDKFLQELQHSRSYDLIDYDSKYDYGNTNDEVELYLYVPSLKITDRSDHWKYITETEEEKEAKDRINKLLIKLKKEDPKGWCLINSVDTTTIVGNEFEEDRAFVCGFSSDKKFNARIDYYAMSIIDDNKLYEQIKKAVQVIVDKSRGHYIKEKAKQLYKETFGMTWK